ncbi:GAF and ANTAR domain-containing protein [Amycolatopsis carbonis]|uniref:GAF and ANTAR domain-containing protein n=1 Tax=Amycolatopsis carbonis TaxID=715471 RepID=A0A9Y2IQT0_9PSEU|nr:GAF and ANTAR domain-containing protein [Amycolatopsis sp. 2-15]WIX82813.1 GAF and ANTAR domain-containing protein [Amycolatopsis sp. 2-15]
MDDRRRQLHRLLAEVGREPVGPRIERVCDVCVGTLGVSGAGATVLGNGKGNGNGAGPGRHRGLVHASDTVSAGLDDLQFTVGEGPCLDAYATGGPILVPDLLAESARWPAFGPAAARLGAAAVFSFPLQVGVVRLGSLDLYRDQAGPLSRSQLADALLLADVATQVVVGHLDGHAVSDLSWLADSHIEIHQAVGMVKVQLGVTADAALLRLRGHAFAEGATLSHVARQVVARTLRFTDEEKPA